ncbi:MAG: methyltransferase domain-containing protein [Actinobacteria bacterium]|nr:methyltransferase domain-containing protein [Actinomycetota bacterium]
MQAPFREAVGDELRPGGLELTEELAAACGLQSGWRVLDLGCGTGSTAAYLVRAWGAEVVGLDCSVSRLAEAQARREDVTWVEGQAERIPYADGFFDVVFAECVISTLGDPERALGEIGRVLRPRGIVAITDVYLRGPVGDSDGTDWAKVTTWVERTSANTCLCGAVNEEVTISRLRDAGFSVRVWRDCSHALKVFIARMIFSYGSAARFWKAALGDGAPCREAIAAVRPGYFLLVAERVST